MNYALHILQNELDKNINWKNHLMCTERLKKSTKNELLKKQSQQYKELESAISILKLHNL